MFKYLAGAAIGAVAIYGGLQLWALSSAGPEFKVWVKQTHIPPNNAAYDILVVQSHEERPVVLKGIVVNDNPKCVSMEMGTHKAGTPVKLGEVYQFGLGIHGFNACDPVRVVITTDRGESTYTFRE